MEPVAWEEGQTPIQPAYENWEDYLNVFPKVEPEHVANYRHYWHVSDRCQRSVIATGEQSEKWVSKRVAKANLKDGMNILNFQSRGIQADIKPEGNVEVREFKTQTDIVVGDNEMKHYLLELMSKRNYTQRKSAE